ncbi:FAD:protein FMN transferase [Paralysiella testudinis]|uniref:FAD:protein FMN transferase n=1 Tax=Paralysiella testudinis TaxID=2809020 RepID=A0A892ZEN8_9NEIS|nr:FAD:protein FMN transferase [Paralysiella testudinis]QRQ81875.1 FAD:protein FMN transferase [Paralysiella testudinis]
MLSIEFDAMGCRIQLVLDSDSAAAAAALQQTPTWFAQWSAQLSRFDADSELSCLNRYGSGQVSGVLWSVLQAALQAARSSNGLVTPTILPALLAAGYTCSFEQLNRQQPERLPEAAAVPDWQRIACNEATQSVDLNGTQLDLGGIAKGWCAQQAAQKLHVHGAVLVDAGGDIAVCGTPANTAAWTVAVAHPLLPQQDAALLYLRSGAVATSGRDYRHWQRHGQTCHHIIDPRSGISGHSDIINATVHAADAVTAEMAAKAILILGSAAAKPWLAAQAHLAACWLSEQYGWQSAGIFDWHTAPPSTQQ